MQSIALLSAGAGLFLCCAVLAEGGTATGKVQTVCGPIDPAKMGRTLTHEHVLVDFIGAEKVSPDRYDADEAFRVMLPYLNDLKAAGIDTLFECTPDYIGRDPALLRRLSIASGLHIVTNTGWYKDPFLPARAREMTAEEIAAEWIAEATGGIGPEKIKPGFIKIAANEGSLTPIQIKIVQAAALTSLATGLTIASHTTVSVAALEELAIIEDAGLPASRLVIVHADADPNPEAHAELARRGAWLSYDGIRKGNAEAKLPVVKRALELWPERLLISQDAGWYHVGEPGGGDVAPLDWLPRDFIPMLKQAGASAETIDRLLIENPARAFTIAKPGRQVP